MPRTTYQTKQKKAILDYLTQSSKQHVTIPQIAKHLKDVGVSVSIPTIYRCMDALVADGVVKKYVLDGNAGSCFQYEDDSVGPENLFHFRCCKCHELLHFQSKELQMLDAYFAKHADAKIDLAQTVFYGTCESCVKKS